VGVVGVSAVQHRLPHQRLFPLAVLGAGGALMAAASMSTLAPAMGFVAAMGVCAGAVYVLGFTMLQESVEDDLRGRIFAAFYSLSRLCLLASLAAAPFVSGALDGMSQSFLDGEIDVFDLTVSLPGVRLTLWLGATIILIAGALATRALQSTPSGERRSQPGTEGT
jgi:dTMP kinase